MWRSAIVVDVWDYGPILGIRHHNLIFIECASGTTKEVVVTQLEVGLMMLVGVINDSTYDRLETLSFGPTPVLLMIRDSAHILLILNSRNLQWLLSLLQQVFHVL